MPPLCHAEPSGSSIQVYPIVVPSETSVTGVNAHWIAGEPFRRH